MCDSQQREDARRARSPPGRRPALLALPAQVRCSLAAWHESLASLGSLGSVVSSGSVCWELRIRSVEYWRGRLGAWRVGNG
eukprot:464964-Rhodomonas_salina.2